MLGLCRAVLGHEDFDCGVLRVFLYFHAQTFSLFIDQTDERRRHLI